MLIDGETQMNPTRNDDNSGGAIEATGPDQIWLRCPLCRAVEVLDGWDVIGADPDKLFCNHCGAEAVPEWLDQ